jgi:DNA-binding transcriptional MerR regulator
MQKLYYSISEVCQMVDEEQHILRYWEKEFSSLKPRKNRGGNRIYSEKDITLIKNIKNLLREEKLSLKGAKEQISKYISEDNEPNLFNNHEVTSSHDVREKLIIDTNLKKSKKKGSFTLKKEEAEELLGIMRQFSGFLKQVQ